MAMGCYLSVMVVFVLFAVANGGYILGEKFNTTDCTGIGGLFVVVLGIGILSRFRFTL